MSSEPKYDRRLSRRINKKNKRKRAGILFLSVLVITIGVTGFLKLKVFNNSSQVQATTIENANDKIENTNDKVDESLQSNEINVIDNSRVEDGKYIEKYIYQQTKGEMPEGADGKKVVYLTFDDGPSENVTPEILDILKEEDVQATFFVLGKCVDNNDKTKEIIKRQVEEGNSIGIHTYSHDYHKLYPNDIVNVDNFMGEVEKTKKSLKDILGDEFDTKIVRLPGGHMSWKGTDALDTKFQEEGYSYIDWNSLSRDAEGPKKNADQLFNEAVKTAGSKEKVVMLMHDKEDKQETVKSLSNVIHHFKKNGYEFKVIK